MPWSKHKSSKGDRHVLEFTDAAPMTMSCELFFDTYESKGNVYKEYIEHLLHLTKVKTTGTEEEKRPPMCIFIWGKNFPRFEGVIESLSIKYTMFLPDGTPCRATATIKMKQASDVVTKVKAKKKSGGSASSGERGDASGGTGTSTA